MFFWTKRKIEKKFQQDKNELEHIKFANEVGGVDTFNDLFYLTKDIGWSGGTVFEIKIRKNAHKEDTFLLNTKFVLHFDYNKLVYDCSTLTDITYRYSWEHPTDLVADIYDWCNKMVKFIYYYSTRQNELEVLNKFRLKLENNDDSYRFNVMLQPAEFKPYIEECRKQYTSDFKENEYKAYIAARFAKTMKKHNIKKFSAIEPITLILPYYHWYTDVYQKNLMMKKFYEEFDLTELNDLVLQRR